MDNPESILQSLEQFPSLIDESDYSIPVELEEYIHYVSKTGDPMFQWSLVKPLMKEKMIKVISEFHDSNPSSEIPDYPNVDKFNYETMKTTLLERLDWFKGAPFTIQRISELLINPTNYNRVDKYMRALEKNIYVVSIREPGVAQPIEENNIFEESFILNGNDFELKPDNEILDTKRDDSATLLQDNIEVDVTNNTPSEDIPVDDNNMESTEINVQDEISESVNSSEVSEDGKPGHTRKLEDGELEENDPKRFKPDSYQTENNGQAEDDLKIQSGLDSAKDQILSNNDMNLEESDPNESLTQNDKSDERTEIKADIEMELEETIDNKIHSFESIENETNHTSLNVSDSDSMVISQESSSEDITSKSLDENSENVVSESSDMDLSDGVNPIIETTECNSDNVSSEVEMSSCDNDVDMSTEDEDSNTLKKEQMSEVSNSTNDSTEQIVSSNSSNTTVEETSLQEIDSSSSDVKQADDDTIGEGEDVSEANAEALNKEAEVSINQGDVDNEVVEETSNKDVDSEVQEENFTIESSSSEDINIKLDTIEENSVITSSETARENHSKEETAPQIDSVDSSEQSKIEEIIPVNISTNPTVSKEGDDESLVESTSDIEEAILREDEYEQCEDNSCNIDPLSTDETEKSDLVDNEADKETTKDE